MMMQVIVIGNYENVMKTVRVMLMVMREGGAIDECQMQKRSPKCSASICILRLSEQRHLCFLEKIGGQEEEEIDYDGARDDENDNGHVCQRNE